MSTSARISVYDRVRPHLDASDLIARLGIDLVRKVGSEAYCRPLCHESTSGESLQINLHTGRWNCKACQPSGVYGDLFQLVEYVQNNGAAPSRGNTQGASEGHRRALMWMCDQFGVPFDADRISGDAGLDVVHMFAMAAHDYLLGANGWDGREDVLAWIAERWGFDRATAEAYGLGFMPSPILPEIAAEASSATSRSAFRASGLGWHDSNSKWHTRFAGRVLFPYLEHGRAVYLIGRATPWTPPLEHGAKPPKYYKLPVHSTERQHISEKVTNDHLYNESIMSTADEIGIVEGVADAVAISSLGVPVVSPVTISFNAVDQERFLRKCHEHGIRRVWVLFDNELSGSGNWGARRVGVQLVEGGLSVKILTVPLGEAQKVARDEVVAALGTELFEELERSEPRERKEIVLRAIPDDDKRAWVQKNIDASKIDAAEWCARAGAGAIGGFEEIRRAGQDVIDLEIEECAQGVNPDSEPSVRANVFSAVIGLVAHIEDRLAREDYAGRIAKAAGKGVTKAEISKRVAETRRDVVLPKKKEEKESKKDERCAAIDSLILLPPEATHSQKQALAPPPSKFPAQHSPSAAASPTHTTPPKGSSAPPPPPPPPGKHAQQSDHERYAPARAAVTKGVEAKIPEEALGEYVAQTIMRSMGYTPFRTADELYLVRGSERIAVGLDSSSARFASLLWLASSLTAKKNGHRAYIAAAIYFLERDAIRVSDVSWSYVDPATSAVYFPTGDAIGNILRIDASGVAKLKMSDVRVPAVAGDEFLPFTYVDRSGGVARALDVFRWTSVSESDRLVLIHWLVCLPILRRIGTVPIIRIEGGSSSGKTRTVDAVSCLVNGQKSSSVPTAPALISRMSTEMLTVDDNRETSDVTPAFWGTLLQATHLGAREKRRGNSDTGTVIERICGALLMNGIEPIHDGKSELASRILTLRCDAANRAPDSPAADTALARALLDTRDAFWSESVRRCSSALTFDAEFGEQIGAKIDGIFGATKIGRLSAYLRMMYLAWVAGVPEQYRQECLAEIAGEWRDAFHSLAGGALESLLAEELSVTVLRYVFAWGRATAQPPYTGSDEARAFDGLYVCDTKRGDAYLGPLKATQLARLARTAGRELNAPRAVTTDLRAGQLDRRILDGLEFIRQAGYGVSVEGTRAGQVRYTFARTADVPPAPSAPQPPTLGGGGDTWAGY